MFYNIDSVTIDLEDENTALVDLNIDQSTPLAAIEPSHELSAKNTWSFYSRKPVAQSQWEQAIAESVEVIAEDNPYMSFVSGQEVSAIDALNFRPGSYGLDVRPRIFDKISKTWTLLDTGSCLTCTPKKPGDKLDPTFKLRSVNGGQISTYGSEMLSIQIGRKNYQIEAVIADVPQKILGWDIFKKYSSI